ncbi:hypothetical protein F4814DRAFT_412677 [Daldinia grandis]|nr:hypothetical protein F4814DRAFT_412677 [Daldinia grandis]
MIRLKLSPTRILTNVPAANAPSRSFVKTFSQIHESSSRYCITLPYDRGDGNAKIDRCTIGTKVCRRTLTIHKDQSWLLLCSAACFADAGRATPPNIPKHPQATPIALGVLCKPTFPRSIFSRFLYIPTAREESTNPEFCRKPFSTGTSNIQVTSSLVSPNKVYCFLVPAFVSTPIGRVAGDSGDARRVPWSLTTNPLTTCQLSIE